MTACTVPAARTASSRCTVPITLVAYVSTGPAYGGAPEAGRRDEKRCPGAASRSAWSEVREIAHVAFDGAHAACNAGESEERRSRGRGESVTGDAAPRSLSFSVSSRP